MDEGREEVGGRASAKARGAAFIVARGVLDALGVKCFFAKTAISVFLLIFV